MRTTLLALAAAIGGGLAARSAAAAQASGSTSGQSTPQVVTSASGESRLTPDRAAVYVGVQTRAASSATAARDNAQRQRAVIDTIAALGVARDQISTQNYSVYPETRFDRDSQKPVVTGYVVSNVVRVELKRTDQVGTVIDASLAKGANQINSLEFFASNADGARREALADAIVKARGDAEAMARAAGGSLGSLLELSSLESGPRPVYRVDAFAARGVAAAVPTPIEPGEQTVRVSITARWLFVPGR